MPAIGQGEAFMRTDQRAPAHMPIEENSGTAAVDGWHINIPDTRTALDAIMAAAREARAFSVFTLNLDHLVKLRTSAAFRAAYQTATFVTADGAPVARLARRHDARIVRTTGADLVLPLAEAAAQAGTPVFLFGTSPEVLATAGARLVANTCGQLDITGTLSPPAGFDPDGPEADAAIARIRDSGARLCFVALGAPKQELFAARAVKQGVPCGFICIGAGLDFLAGEQVRAPGIFQKSGMEWLWRLSTNPRRLAVRYAQCGLLLARLTLLEPLFGTNAQRPSS